MIEYHNNSYKEKRRLILMDEFFKFMKLRAKTNVSYMRRNRKEKRVWRGFADERRALEQFVGNEFEKVLKEISPIPAADWALKGNPNIGNAEVLGYEVEYTTPATNESGRETNPGYFFVRITRLKLPDGTIIDNDDILSHHQCPHTYLESICGAMRGEQPSLNPRIRDFMRRYNVYHIAEPHNECHHQ